MKFDVNSQFENIMKENIPFPTPLRKVDFLGINLIIMQDLYGKIINVHWGPQKKNKWGGRGNSFLGRKTTEDIHSI